MIGLGGRLARRRNDQDRQCVIQRSARPKILVGFTRLQNTDVAGLMAGHAEIIDQGGTEPRGIDDVQVVVFGVTAGRQHRCPVSNPWSVAVFTADRQFGKRRVLKLTTARGDRARTATVAKNTAGENGTAESVVTEFVSR